MVCEVVSRVETVWLSYIQKTPPDGVREGCMCGVV